MNKKAFSLAIILSMATTGAFASDVVSTSVNNGDKLTKLQKEAKGGNWQKGQRFSSSPSDSTIKDWTDSLK